MTATKRTPRETAKVVATTIAEIRRNKDITDSLITSTCNKYGVSESHIRRVGGWKGKA